MVARSKQANLDDHIQFMRSGFNRQFGLVGFHIRKGVAVGKANNRGNPDGRSLQATRGKWNPERGDADRPEAERHRLFAELSDPVFGGVRF